METKEIQTSNILMSYLDLTKYYPNRKKKCIGCGDIYFVSLKKTIKKSKYCSRVCSDKNMLKGFWNKGKKMSIESRQKLSKAVSGSKSYLWKGGITETNKLIRQGLKYRLWRESVFERDDYTCQDCGNRGCQLNADHIKPFAYFKELRFKLSNGKTLCVECHKKTDTYAYKSIKKHKYAN